MRSLKQYILIAVSLATFTVYAEVKNVIIMIPDGTSTSMQSVARWYNRYINGVSANLAIDKYICGEVATYNISSPVANSSSAATAFYTGHLSYPAFLSILPPPSDIDMRELTQRDSYRPIITIFEAASLNGLSTGLVATSEYTHATPAAAFSHLYNRGNYDVIAKQFAYSSVDVVIAGGAGLIKDKGFDTVIKERGYTFIDDSIEEFRATDANRYYALFNNRDMPFATDRDSLVTPSLAEMTSKAISSLSKNSDGFILMVEGSKVDWANHSNDARAAIDDYLDFDNACAVAINYAKESENTIVIVMSDHGNGGVTINGNNSSYGYDKMPLDSIFAPIDMIKTSTYNMADIIKRANPADVAELFKEYYNFTLSDDEINEVLNAPDYTNSTVEQRTGANLMSVIAKFANARLDVNYQTTGHTADAVLLAMYHPNSSERLMGLVENTDIAPYILEQLGFDEGYLNELSEELYVSHKELFAADSDITLTELPNNGAVIRIKTAKGSEIIAESFTNYVTVDGKRVETSVPIVYIDKIETMFLPREIAKF